MTRQRVPIELIFASLIFIPLLIYWGGVLAGSDNLTQWGGYLGLGSLALIILAAITSTLSFRKLMGDQGRRARAVDIAIVMLRSNPTAVLTFTDDQMVKTHVRSVDDRFTLTTDRKVVETNEEDLRSMLMIARGNFETRYVGES